MSELSNNHLYSRLSLQITATQDEIQKAFDKIQTAYCAKRGEKTSKISQKKFEEIKSAYKILSRESVKR